MEKEKKSISKKTILIASALILAIGLPLAYFLWNESQEDVGAWYDSSWIYRRSITVGDPGTEQTSAEVLIVVDTATLVTATKLQSDCDDLRFVDSDDSTALAYWVEGGCNTSTTNVWIQIPTLPVGGKTIYMYYGNTTATNAEQTWTGKFILLKNSSCDTGWTTESGSGGDFFEKFPFGSSSYGTPGGSARHTHSDTSLQTNTTAISQNISRNSGASTALNHYHEVTITMDTPSSDILPPYLDMIYCSNTDLIVKQNTVSLFDSTLPSGFTRFSALDSKFPRGNSTYGGSSSTTTHNHPLNSATTVGPSATGTCVSGTTQVPTDTHTHPASASTSATGTMLPEYLTMIYGQADTDIMAPAATITMSNAIPPLGWSSFSALTSKFPYGSSSYGTTGGTTTHTHSVSTTTGNESATVGCSTGTPRTTRMLTHSHTVDGNLTSASNNPPYIETLFIKKNSSISTTINNEELNNQVPNAPSALTTEEATNPTGVTDTTPEFSSLYTDAESDAAAFFQIQVNTTNTFDGTTIWDSTKTAATITHNSRSAEISYGTTPLALNGTTYYWRMKYWDNQGGESSWSSVAQFTMDTANSAPNSPSALQTEGSTNPIKVSTSTPNFTAIYSDPDADAGTHYQVQINTTNTFDGTSIWDSTQTAMTLTNNTRSGNITYNGTPLVEGTTYYWRIKFWDNGGLPSEWSSVGQFTMSGVPNAPTSLETEGATNPTSVTDTTPEFTAIHTDPNQDIATHYEIEVNTQSDFLGTTMWDSNQTAIDISNNTRSADISYNGTTLSLDGSTYYWRIRFWDSQESVSEWSTTASFTLLLNIAPNTPSSLNTEQSINPTNVFDLDPEFSAIFTDINSNDTGTHYEIEVNTNNSFTGVVMWDSNQTETVPITNGERSSDIVYGGSPLTLDGSTYYWRIRFWDSNGSVSDWSNTHSFSMYDPSPTNPEDEGGGLVEGAGVEDFIQFSGVGLQGIKVAVPVTNQAPNAPTNLDFRLSTTPICFQYIWSATFSDPDASNTGNYYEVEINTNSSFSGTVMADTGQSSISPISNGSSSGWITISPSPLSLGGTYYWRIRFWDNDGAVSDWSSTSFSMPPFPPCQAQ